MKTDIVIENQMINCVIPVKEIDIEKLFKTLSVTQSYGQMNLKYFYELLQTRPYLCITYHYKTNRFTYHLTVDTTPSQITLPYEFEHKTAIHKYIRDSYYDEVKKYRFKKLNMILK